MLITWLPLVRHEGSHWFALTKTIDGLLFIQEISFENIFSWNQIAQSKSPTVTKYNPKTQTYLNLQP